MEDVAIALSFPIVEARAWLSTSGVGVRLLPSFSSFYVAVINALAINSAARLYWFPNESSPISARRPVLDDATFSAFRDAWSEGLRPIVWAYTPPSADSTRSPEQLPAAAPAPPLPTAVPIATPVAKSASSAGTRSSAQQREFRSSLETRDQKSFCVACERAGPAEAAHVLRRGSRQPLLESAGLLSAWDVRNGVMLCSICHLYFDKFFWCVGVDGLVVVSQALLSYDELRDHFSPLVGRPLRHAVDDVNWPRELTWACHRQLFEAARVQRHADYGVDKLVCADCGSLFLTSRAWKYHIDEKAACEKRIRDGRKVLWTPLERRTFPDLAVNDDADDAAARRLSLVDEGGGGVAADGHAGDEEDGMQ